MMVRLMRMTPPGHPYWSAVWRVPHQTRRCRWVIYELLSVFGLHAL